MPMREEQFQNHSVHTALSQLDSALQEKSAKELSDGAIDNLDRTRQATAFIRSRMDVASPLLTPSNRLDQIQKSLQGCLNEINQFNSNGNEGHLSNASNQIDAGLNNAAVLISLEQPEPSVKAEDAVSFKTLAEEVISSLRDKAQSVEERAEQIGSSLHDLEKRSEEQNTQINSIQSTLDSKLKELENQFAAAQTIERQLTWPVRNDSFNNPTTTRLSCSSAFPF